MADDEKGKADSKNDIRNFLKDYFPESEEKMSSPGKERPQEREPEPVRPGLADREDPPLPPVRREGPERSPEPEIQPPLREPAREASIPSLADRFSSQPIKRPSAPPGPLPGTIGPRVAATGDPEEIRASDPFDEHPIPEPSDPGRALEDAGGREDHGVMDGDHIDAAEPMTAPEPGSLPEPIPDPQDDTVRRDEKPESTDRTTFPTSDVDLGDEEMGEKLPSGIEDRDADLPIATQRKTVSERTRKLETDSGFPKTAEKDEREKEEREKEERKKEKWKKEGRKKEKWKKEGRKKGEGKKDRKKGEGKKRTEGPRKSLYKLDRSTRGIRKKLAPYTGGLFGAGKKRTTRGKDEFNPIMVEKQELIMLFSGFLLAGIFIIFILYEEKWHKNYDLVITVVFYVLLATIISSLVALFISDSTNPRLRGSIKKKAYFSIIGFILIVAGSSLFIYWHDDGGILPLSSWVIAYFGFFFFIIASQTMSKFESCRFLIFFVGAIILILVPGHEVMDVMGTDFPLLPLDPINTVLLIIGSVFTTMGILLLRERSGYFGIWITGLIVLFLVPLHEYISFVDESRIELFDQSYAILGTFFLFVGYMMFFYRFRHFMAMSGAVFTGNKLYERGKYNEAEKHYWKAFWILETMGNIMDYDVIWGNLGNILVKRNDHNGALAYFEMGISINGNNDMLWNDKGNLFYLLGDYKKAMEAYQHGIDLNDRNPVLFQNLGVAQSASGSHEHAILNYERAIKLDPKYEKAWHNKGRAYHDLGDFGNALTAYDSTLRLNQQSYAWLDRGEVLFNLERYEEAMKSFNRAIKFYSDDPDAWIHMGTCHYALRMYDKAIADFNKAIELDDTLTLPYNLLGNSYVMMRDLPRAKQYYEEAIARNPGYSRAKFNLARIQARLNEDAIDAYESAVGSTDRQRLNDEWFEEAIAYYNNAIQTDPANSRAWRGRGNLLFKIGKLSSAISSYTKAVEHDPDNATLHNLLGISQRKTGHLEDALRSFEEATRLDPLYYDVWNNKGNVLYLMGKFNDALKAYNHAIDIYPDNQSALSNRHLCITQLKSDIKVETVPLMSTVVEFMNLIKEFRDLGFNVDILENLLQEGKPNTILQGFNDYKERVLKIKLMEAELSEITLDEKIRGRLREIMRDPAQIGVINELVNEVKMRAEQGTVSTSL